MEFKDYYQVLGVGRDAPQDGIKRAYRRLARKYHPDVSKEADAEERFKELGEAYEVLKDPEKRAAYDQLGQNWQAGQDFQPPPDWDTGFEFRGGGYTQEDAAAFSDFFESLFGRSGFGQRGFHDAHRHGVDLRGEDHHARIQIELEDAYRGATRTITLQSAELDARGRIQRRERRLNVRIPKGIRQGQRIRLSGQGGPGLEGGKAGDLYLEVEFNVHNRYRVEGHDVFLELPVTPWEAALGATVRVPTPDGSVELKIPAESHAGQRLRLKGRGIPGKPPGDFYAILQVVLPPADNERARQAYRRMAEELSFNPRADLGV
ncbi:DnaJ C-terminal domain-containing protein [Halomonas shantousis]